MSSHPEELLHSYIILGPSKLSRSETGEIPAVLQDSLSSKVVHIELLYLRRIWLTDIGVSVEIVQFCGLVQFSGRWKTPVLYEGVEIVHFPAQNSAPIAF